MRPFRLALAVITAVAVVSTAGCGHFYPFGPPDTPTTAPRIPCQAKTRPASTIDPFTGRPLVVPPGFAWIVLSVEVRALDADRNSPDYCVPFTIHVTGQQEGNPGGVVMLNGQPLPYDAQVVTPYTRDKALFAYDPTSPRWLGHPPSYELQVTATYLADLDLFGAGHVAAIRCAIKANGATIAQDIKIPGRPNATVAQCSVRATAYNPF